jgi:rhodanese-related sulfurtransferase
VSAAAVLDAARMGLARLGPHDAVVAAAGGALLVDTRPEDYRRAEGEIPGSLVLERNVLEWRLDPTGPDRVPVAAPDLHVVVVCNEGYASSLAAASLRAVGVWRATDLDGGFRAWRAAGLPVVGGTPTAPGCYVTG